jgi:hypothetical protein
MKKLQSSRIGRSWVIKRSMVITLVLLGTVGVVACSDSDQKRCVADNSGRASDCRSSIGGVYGGYSISSRSGQSFEGTVPRGGFGATGQAISGGHGSGS